ncbi:MAG: hypothetical protein R2695_04610 [Acidimicrobiales bacterium]
MVALMATKNTAISSPMAVPVGTVRRMWAQVSRRRDPYTTALYTIAASRIRQKAICKPGIGTLRTMMLPADQQTTATDAASTPTRWGRSSDSDIAAQSVTSPGRQQP